MARVTVPAEIAGLVVAAAAAAVYASSGQPALHGGAVSRGATVAVQVEVFGWVLVLAALAWAGRRHGPLGPTAPGLPPRMLRGIGALLILVFFALTVDDLHTRPGGDSGNMPVWLAICVVITCIYTIAFLAASSGAAAIDLAGLAVSTGIGVVAGLGWFAVVLSRPTLPADNNWAVPTVVVGAALAAVWAVVRTGRTDHGVKAGLVAGATSALLIFVVTMLTFRLDGSRVPHIVDRVMIAGSTPAQTLVEDRIEAPDFYMAVLLLGALLAAALIGSTFVSSAHAPRAPRERSREPLVLEG